VLLIDTAPCMVHCAAKSSHVDLGTVPAWIGAIGTTLAFLVAFAVFWLSLAERRRHQASQVAAWFARGDTQATLHVANSSDVPVYNVRVDPKLLGQTSDPIRYPVLGPRTNETDLTIPMPGSRQVSNLFFGVEVFFSDSAGRRWFRAAGGKLRRKYRSYD
jgi:hypothetical protein